MDNTERLMRLNGIESMKKPDLEQVVAELRAKVEELTYSLKEISERASEVVKKDDADMPAGNYVNPILFYDGMEIISGLFYTDGEDIWEAIQSGVPNGFGDVEFFDVIM